MPHKKNKPRIPQPLTTTVPLAGKLLGLGKSASYEAAKNDQLPVIRIGGRLLVPLRSLERMLDMEPGSLGAEFINSGIDQLGHNGGPPLDEAE